MKRSQQTKPQINEENVYRRSKWACSGGNVGKSRTPLGDIQDSVNKSQYLSANYCQLEKTRLRSRSSSFFQVLSPTKPSSELKQVQYESTRIAAAPSFKQHLIKLPATVTVRPTQIPESHIPVPPKAPVRARSNSCRCPSTFETYTDNFKKALKKDELIDLCEYSSDDVFLQSVPTKTRTEPKNPQVPTNKPKIIISSTEQLPDFQNDKHFYDSQLHVGNLQKGGPGLSRRATTITPSTINKGRSAENLSHSHNLKTISSSSGSNRSQHLIPLKQDKHKQNSQDGEGFVPWYTPDLLHLKQKVRSSSTSSSIKPTAMTSRSSCCQRAQNTASSSHYQKSTASQGITQSCCSTKSKTEKSIQSCCSTKSKTEKSIQRYTTVPSQHFETFTHDTLKTTIGSDTSDLGLMTFTLNKVKTVRDTSIYSDEERTFVDGEKFFHDLEEGKSTRVPTIPLCSPLSINVPLRRSSSVSEGATVKRVKTTLRRKSSIKKVIVFPLLYCPEYLEDIVAYSYKYKNNFILKTEWIEAYVDKRYRSATVNWLLQVTELILPHFNVYYMAIRIFDYTVIRLKLRKLHYQLAAIVSFWISLKYLDNSVLLKIPKIFALCNGQYSKEQILSMERTTLKSIKFCLNVADPLDFLNYYLKSSNLEKNEIVKYGSQFVLECATIFENYSLADPAFIAACALHLAYRICTNTKDVYINFIWFERNSLQKYADRVLAVNVKYVIMEKYEPLNKYLTAQKMQVAKNFFHI